MNDLMKYVLLLCISISAPALADDGLIARWEVATVDQAKPYPGVVHLAGAVTVDCGSTARGTTSTWAMRPLSSPTVT